MKWFSLLALAVMLIPEMAMAGNLSVPGRGTSYRPSEADENRYLKDTQKRYDRFMREEESGYRSIKRSEDLPDDPYSRERREMERTPVEGASSPATATKWTTDKNGKPIFRDMTRRDCKSLDDRYGQYGREEFQARSIYCDRAYKADYSLEERQRTPKR